MSETLPGLLVVLSGPSGVGKDALIRELKGAMPELHYVVTATTRGRRQGEVHGTDYYFMSREEFESKVDRNEFLEWSWVHGNLYGPPLSPVQQQLSEGKTVLLKIDVQGAAKVRVRAKNGIFIFLAPPSLEGLINRLEARATESSAELEVRIANARAEMAAASSYDYYLVNEDNRLSDTVGDVRQLITQERSRPGRLASTIG